jgi:hypothetical protein
MKGHKRKQWFSREQHTSDSPEGLLKPLLGSTPRVWVSTVLGWSLRVCNLTSFQKELMLLIWEICLDNH